VWTGYSDDIETEIGRRCCRARKSRWRVVLPCCCCCCCGDVEEFSREGREEVEGVVAPVADVDPDTVLEWEVDIAHEIQETRSTRGLSMVHAAYQRDIDGKSAALVQYRLIYRATRLCRAHSSSKSSFGLICASLQQAAHVMVFQFAELRALCQNHL
jgi:hypothetical protein